MNLRGSVLDCVQILGDHLGVAFTRIIRHLQQIHVHVVPRLQRLLTLVKAGESEKQELMKPGTISTRYFVDTASSLTSVVPPPSRYWLQAPHSPVSGFLRQHGTEEVGERGGGLESPAADK